MERLIINKAKDCAVGSFRPFGQKHRFNACFSLFAPCEKRAALALLRNRFFEREFFEVCDSTKKLLNSCAKTLAFSFLL